MYKNCSLFTLLIATDQKHKNHEKVILTTKTSPESQCYWNLYSSLHTAECVYTVSQKCPFFYFWITLSKVNWLWPPYVIGGHYIFALWFLSIFFFYSSLNLSGRRLDVYHTLHTWHGPSANLECRSEMCCTRLAGNTGRKNDEKNRHLRTIAQLCRTISSQLRHTSTIGKKTS